MIYRGIFKDYSETDCEVVIRTNDGDPSVVRMDAPDSDIRLLTSPVTVSTAADDMFQTVTVSTADIGLLSKEYLGGEMFASNDRDILVNVLHNNKVIFAGYLEPNVYNQPYARKWDSLSLTANDGLSTLQYRPYMDIRTQAEYDSRKSRIDSITVGSIIEAALEPVRKLSIGNASYYSNVYYDGSVRLSQSAPADSILNVRIYEALMFGEEFDDLKMYDELFDDILKYFNLHIRQVGLDYYIWHQSSIGSNITWYPILGSSGTAQSVEPVQTGYYEIVHDSYMVFHDEYRQKLRHSITGEEIPGKRLNIELGMTVTYVSGQYRRYYYAILPNQSKVRTELYEVTDISGNLDYLKKDGNYKILLQGPRGDYEWASLENAPQSAYSGSSLKYPYYQVSQSEYILDN